MTLFRPKETVEARAANLSAAELIAQHRNGGRVWAGVPVNDDQAMRLSAVWGCVDLIAEIVSTLPIHEYTDTGPGGTPERQQTPRLLLDPGGDGYGFEVWARAYMISSLLRGNEFGLIHALDDRSYPLVIENLHPDRVTYYEGKWHIDNKVIDRYPYGEAQLWHVPSYSVPGTPLGLSPISYAAQTIGLGLAAQKFGGQWFGDGAHPTSKLTNKDGALASEDDAKLLKSRIHSTLYNNRETLVLGGGWDLEPVQVSPNESQFLETTKANADDIARYFFRRPPGEGGEVTYANVEARSLDMLTYTINGWLVRMERAITRLRPRGRYVKFNADAMLRPDTKTKAEIDVLTIRGGVQTPNERRRLHDLSPLPGGDELLWPPFTTKSAADSDMPEGGTDEEP